MFRLLRITSPVSLLRRRLERPFDVFTQSASSEDLDGKGDVLLQKYDIYEERVRVRYRLHFFFFDKEL